MNCHVCGKEPASCWCPCPLCGKSSTAEPGSPEACGCAYEDLTVALRARVTYAVQLAGAFLDDALTREIAMQVRAYKPINEANVRELLDDIRQGIAIYLEEHGLAEKVTETTRGSIGPRVEERHLDSQSTGTADGSTPPPRSTLEFETWQNILEAKPLPPEFQKVLAEGMRDGSLYEGELRHQSNSNVPDDVRNMLLHSGSSNFLLTIDNVNADGSIACQIVPTPRATGYEQPLRFCLPNGQECVHQVANGPTWADGMERAAGLCEEEAESARLLIQDSPNAPHAAKDRIASVRDSMALMAKTIRAFKAEGPELRHVAGKKP